MNKPHVKINNWSLGQKNARDYFEKHPDDAFIYLFGTIVAPNGVEQHDHKSDKLLGLESIMQRKLETDGIVYELGSIQSKFKDCILARPNLPEDRRILFESYEAANEDTQA